jgi:hypothetical protein
MVIREMRSQMEQLGLDIPVSNVDVEKDKGCSEGMFEISSLLLYV